MEQLTTQEAISAVEQANNKQNVSVDLISTLVSDDAVCEMVYATKVKTAAAFKDVTLYKVTKSNVILPTSGEVYRNMVIQSAVDNGTDSTTADKYTVGDTYYSHTNVYPVCEHKEDPTKKYLYSIYKGASNSIYLKDGITISKDEVATYLTASEAKKLLEEKDNLIENKSQGLTHAVSVRTISLGNVVSLKQANQQVN